MAVYLVTYDLLKPGQDYQKLFQALQTRAYCRPLESVWFIVHPGNSVAVRDWLTPFLDANDRLFVSRQTGDWAGRTMGKCGDWLNKQQL